MPTDDAPTSPVEGAVGTSRDAFLSYASSDAEVAARVCGLLEGDGISVWMAPRDVPAGANYADAIVRAINGCRTLLVILSAHSVSSAHVGKEIERASSKRRPIVAIRLDDTELTPALEYFLSESQWIDARAGLQSALPKLIHGIRRIGAPGALPPPAVTARVLPASAAVTPATSRAHVMLIGAAVVVLIGGLLAWRAGWLQRPVTPVTGGPENTSAPAAAALVTAKKSIAVLPFADLSEKKDQEYFSDGLSEELIDLLGKVPGLRVPASTSSFYFKGKQATLAEIGKALNVSHVLEGSVRKSGKQLRITTELVSVGDDTRVWSETYDRQLDDVFKVQDDIANSVVTALKVSMLGEALPRATPTANSDAYLHYLLAREGMRSEGDSFERVDSELRKALQLDPSFAAAWLLLGTLHIKSRDADPLFYDNYRQLGNAYYRAGRLDEAAAVLNEAAQRFPTAQTVHYRIGLVRLQQHRLEDALTEFKLEQDGAFQVLGPPLALDALGRHAESDQILNQTLATNKAVTDAAAYQVALIYANRGDRDAAFHWLERAMAQRDAGMHWMKFDPLLKGLRSDPRFQALLVKLHQA